MTFNDRQEILDELVQLSETYRNLADTETHTDKILGHLEALILNRTTQLVNELQETD